MPSRLTVLGWHNVEPTWCFPGQRPGVERLERQLRQIRAAATVLPLGHALDALQAGEPLPPRAVALCWDDGYRDNLDLAVPLLERLGLSGTFFLVPGLLSGERCAWWETVGWAFENSTRAEVTWRGLPVRARGPGARTSYELVSDHLRGLTSADRPGAEAELLEALAPTGQPPGTDLFLDWAGAHELLERGFEVGSHTLAHNNLATESAEAQVQDLRASREVLENKLGAQVSVVAYPFGQADAVSSTTAWAAAEAGYAHGLTTQAGVNTSRTGATHAHRVMLDPAQGFLRTLAVRAQNRIVRRSRPRRSVSR